MTVSIGAAVFPANGPTLDDVVRAADLAMYRAKAQGRNRVAAAETTQPSLVAQGRRAAASAAAIVTGTRTMPTAE